MKTLHVGIDVAKDSFVTHLKTDEGSSLGKSRSWDYAPQAVRDLEKQLTNTLRMGAYARVRIGLEATSFYDWHLADSRDLVWSEYWICMNLRWFPAVLLPAIMGFEDPESPSPIPIPADRCLRLDEPIAAPRPRIGA